MELAKLALPDPLVALVAPDIGMERVARRGTFALPFTIAMTCALLAGGAAALRVNAKDSTLQQLERKDPAKADEGDRLKTMSDKQVADAQKSNERGFEVKRVALSVVEVPLAFGLSLLGLVILSWFLRGKLKSTALFAVCGVSLLPGAIANVLDAIAALRHEMVPPSVLQHLSPRSATDFAAALGHPLTGPLGLLGSALDLYSLWGAVLLGFGLAAAAGLPVRRALPAALFAWALWRLVIHVAILSHLGG